MKTAVLIGLLASLALPVAAKTRCDHTGGSTLCMDLETGAYEYYQHANRDIWIQGRCGGAVKWGDISFPTAVELHQIACGKDANLQLQ